MYAWVDTDGNTWRYSRISDLWEKQVGDQWVISPLPSAGLMRTDTTTSVAVVETMGPQGLPGEDGSDGNGFTWRGDYDNQDLYLPYDVITYGGSMWVCIGETIQSPDTEPTSWELAVEKGEKATTAWLELTGVPPFIAAADTAADARSLIGAQDVAWRPDSTDITDAGATGRALLTSSDIAAVRTALGITGTGYSVMSAASKAAGRTALDAEYTGTKGLPGGYAPLDQSGVIDPQYLPSVADDVLEYTNLAAFPAIGEGGKLYVARDTGDLYRWSMSGQAYLRVSDRVLSTGITDATTVGRAVITAEDAAAARTAIGAENAAAKGQADGYAPLNSSTKIDAAYLPAYVNDVFEYATLANLPATGESNKIYVTLDTGFTYRWSGTTYVRISDSVAVAGITDSTVVGRALVTAVDAAAARATLSAENTATKGQPNGYASLDGGGKVPVSQLPNAIMEYQGTWDAATNTPALANGTGSPGDVYRVTVAGTRFGLDFQAGDYAIYNGSTWEKSDSTDTVASVNGYTGTVVLAKSDVGLGNVDNTSDATKWSATATVSNKTLDNTTVATVKDAHLTLQDDTDTTKQARFQLSGLTTETTRTYSLPDADATLVGTATTQTLTGKTLSGTDNTFTGIPQSAITDLTGDLGDLADDLSDLTTELGAKEATVNKGQANGYVPLNGSTKIDSTYLPSYVDDLLEYDDLAAFPGTGETGKLYVAKDTGDTYRWSGTQYVRISDRILAAGITDSTETGRSLVTATDAAAARAAISAESTATKGQAGGYAPLNGTTKIDAAYLPDTVEYTTAKGQANGYAALDGDGKVPDAQLPNTVNDVIEFASMVTFPAIGEAGRIYVDLSTNYLYRWDDDEYAQVGGTLAATQSYYAATVGNGVSTSFTITHNLGTLDVVIGVWETATGTEVNCDKTRTSTNVVTLTFAEAPTSNAYRVMIFSGGVPAEEPPAPITNWVTYSVTDAQTLANTAGFRYIVLLGAGAVATLPTAVDNESLYTLKNVHTADRTVATTGSQTVEGLGFLLLSPGASVELVSDGANWRII